MVPAERVLSSERPGRSARHTLAHRATVGLRCLFKAVGSRCLFKAVGTQFRAATLGAPPAGVMLPAVGKRGTLAALCAVGALIRRERIVRTLSTQPGLSAKKLTFERGRQLAPPDFPGRRARWARKREMSHLPPSAVDAASLSSAPGGSVWGIPGGLVDLLGLGGCYFA